MYAIRSYYGYETPYFEASLPVSLYDWRYPRVGLSLRYHFLSIDVTDLNGNGCTVNGTYLRSQLAVFATSTSGSGDLSSWPDAGARRRPSIRVV